MRGPIAGEEKRQVFLTITPTSLQRRKFVRTEDYGWKERKVKFQKPAITAFFYLINAVLRVLPWRQDDDPNRNPKGVY